MLDSRAGFSPTRLALARRRRGLTKTKLASLAGVDVRSISGFETGEYSPGEETLSRFVEALAFPEDFFFGEDLSEPSPDAASFRALSTMTASKRDMALGQGAIALHLERWISSRFELPQPDLPDLGRDLSPEVASAAIRTHWGLGELPVTHLVHLLEAKGVRVFSLSVDADDVDAFSMWHGSTPFIFLNMRKSAERSRFDAAHELGHLLLHRHGPPQGKHLEREADAFASAFLMPRASVLSLAPRFPVLSHLVQLKKRWGVSVGALAYRLHVLEVLSDWHYRSLCVEMSQKGFRKREPEEGARESSQLLSKVFALLRKRGVGRQQVAAELHILPRELDELVFGLTTTAVPSDSLVAQPKTTPSGVLRRVK